MKTRYWAIAYWILFPCWILGAWLFMQRYHGGFLTNYLSDLSFPPWYYIHLRGLNRTSAPMPRLVLAGRWFGQTPERAALSIFLVGTVAEFKTLWWPGGIIVGTFDPWDIAAYAVGLVACYVVDKWARLIPKGDSL